jgi:hypothetical protein
MAKTRRGRRRYQARRRRLNQKWEYERAEKTQSGEVKVTRLEPEVVAKMIEESRKKKALQRGRNDFSNL